MNNRDNGFGDAFAKDVLNIMNSKEHKELFSKTAQVNVDFGDDLRDEALSRRVPGSHEVGSPAPGAVSGVPMEDRPYTGGTMSGTGNLGPMVDRNVPGVSDLDMDAAELGASGDNHDSFLKDKGQELMSNPDLVSNPALLDVANKAALGQPLTESEKELVLNASKKLRMSKKSQELPELQDYPVSKTEWDKLDDEKKAFLRSKYGNPPWEKAASKNSKMSKKSQELPELQDYPVSKTEWDKLDDEKKAFLRSKYGEPPWEKTANVIDTLVVVADYLGENGYKVSENIADRLIKSIIVEASKKTAGEKCEKCECECDSCECDMEKKD